MQDTHDDLAHQIADRWATYLPDLSRDLLTVAIRLERTLKSLDRELSHAVTPFGRHGIRNMEDFRLLAVLRRVGDEGITITEASQEIGITKASTSARVERLVQEGLVHRDESEVDRRATRLTLDPSAAQLVDDCQKATLGVYDRVLGDFTKAEQDELAALLRRFRFEEAL